MSGFDWVPITAQQFEGYIAHRVKLPCSCRLFFYYGTNSVPEVKMERYRAKYYVDSSVIHRDQDVL